MKKAFVLFILLFALNGSSQTGTSCATAMPLYPAASGDCSNLSGLQYEGGWQCPNGGCGSYQMTGSSGGLDPACTSDNESTQSVLWVAITATATSFSVTNDAPYTGGPGAAANTHDFVIYSGSCGNLTQIGCYTLDGNDVQAVTGLTVGQTYYMMVSPSSGATTADFTDFCITSSTAYNPTNNNCANATSLTTNTYLTDVTNANSTADGPGAVCLNPASGSVENNVWYQWCAPSNWPAGQTAYLSVTNVVCSSTDGLQVGVFNGGQTCGTFTSSLVCQNPGNVTSFYYSWTAVASTCYYINVDGFAGAACQYDIGVGSAVILPVRFSSFDVSGYGDFDEVKWSTFMEKDADHFLLERSIDGENYQLVEKLDSKGDSEKGFDYYSKVLDIKPGETFYRITQVDKNGFSSSLPPKSVIRKGNNFENFYWSCPDGSENCNLTFYSSGGDRVTVNIYDLSGKLVQSTSFDPEKGNNTTAINCTDLQKGLYILSVSDSYSSKTMKFFRQ